MPLRSTEFAIRAVAMQGVPMKVAATECFCSPSRPFSELKFRAPPGLTMEVGGGGLGMCKQLSDASTGSPGTSGRRSPSAGSLGSSKTELPGIDPREWRTTLHIRNLPCYFTRSTLQGLLGAHGLAMDYDFMYLPMDFQTKLSMGYAFVNFCSSRAAQLALAALQGFSRWPIHSHKVCSIQWSRTQGLEANVDLVCNSGVMSDMIPDEYKPTVFMEGKVVAFPAGKLSQKTKRKPRATKCRAQQLMV